MGIFWRWWGVDMAFSGWGWRLYIILTRATHCIGRRRGFRIDVYIFGRI